MDLGLAGRTALITGASKGIGRAIADRLASEGCHLHLAARSREDLDVLATELRARHSVDVTVHALDLSRHDEVQRLGASCGTPDILVNNAGAIPSGGLQDVEPTRWRSAWDLKVFGYVDLTRILLPRMYERGSGTVICVIGSAGLSPNPNYLAGCMGNAALNMFVQCIGSESIDHGVRVLAVNPGATLSERLDYLMRETARRKFGDPERYKELMSSYPAGRAAKVEEVAAAVAFLSSDLSGYTSGSELTIDGGRRFRKS